MGNLLLSVTALLVFALFAIACGGDGQSPAAGPTPTSTESSRSPTPTHDAIGFSPAPPEDKERQVPERTGIAELDAIVDAFVVRSNKALLPLLHYSVIPCSHTTGIGGPPLCRPDQPEDATVEVMPVSSCELELHRPHEFEKVLVPLVERDLYGVYRSSPEVRFPGDYVIVLSAPLSTDGEAGTEVVIEDGRIVGVDFSCIVPPDDLVEMHQLGEPLFLPNGQ
jgi:hypothetical protein